MLDSVGVEEVRWDKKGTGVATTILCGSVSYRRNVGDRRFCSCVKT
jgi:hypothetical protein